MSQQAALPPPGGAAAKKKVTAAAVQNTPYADHWKQQQAERKAAVKARQNPTRARIDPAAALPRQMTNNTVLQSAPESPERRISAETGAAPAANPFASAAEAPVPSQSAGTSDPSEALRHAGQQTIQSATPARAGQAGSGPEGIWDFASRDPATWTADQRDAMAILGQDPSMYYSGDPEDVARAEWARLGVSGPAEYRDALDYMNRNTAGGAIGTVRDAVNDMSYHAQASIAEQEAENAYWADVANGGPAAGAAYQQFLDSLAPGERETLEYLGQLPSPESVYYQQVVREAQERHSNDVPVQAVNWGEEYDRETQRMAKEKGFSDQVLQAGSRSRSLGRMLPAAALSALGGIGAGLVGGEAAGLILNASRALAGSLTFHSAAGSAYETAVNQGADPMDAFRYATAAGAAELLTESLINGMGRIGGRAIGLGGPGNTLAKKIAQNVTGDAAGQEAILMLCDMIGEGAEGFLSELGGYFADRLVLGLDDRTFGQVLRDAGEAVLPSMMTSAIFELNSLMLSGLPPELAIQAAVDDVVDTVQAAAAGEAAPGAGRIGEGRESIGGENTKPAVFSDLQSINAYGKMEEAAGGKSLQQRKPEYSPALRRWFNNGGTVEIRVEGGHEIWTYVTADGIRGEYVDGGIRFSADQLHPKAGRINVGEFVSRSVDKRAALQLIASEYKMLGCPEGFVLHHDLENGVMLLVREDMHRLFTHRGGFSIFVTNGGKGE